MKRGVALLGMVSLVYGSLAHAEVKAPILVPQKPQLTPLPAVIQMREFPELRNEVLKLIAKAKQRVWLATDYLSDGEIVTALYLARYRNLDVQVLLGKKRATEYLSRLHDLKKNETPVFLQPEGLFDANTSALVIDQDCFRINAPLDYRLDTSAFQMKRVRPSDGEGFIAAFQEAIGKVPAYAKPMPLVGRARTSGPRAPAPWLPAAPQTRRPPRTTASTPTTTTPPYQGEANGVYNYNKSTTVNEYRRNVPRALPKVPKYQMKRQD